MRKINDDELLRLYEQGIQQKDIAIHFDVSPAAVCKRLKRIKPLPESLMRLSDKERQFALQKAMGKSNTEAASISHDTTTRDSAKALGHNLMKKPDIQVAVAELMQEEGLTRRHRVAKLKEHVDAPDPNVSLKALDQTWKLEGLYTEKHVVAHITRADMERNIRESYRQIAELEAELGISGEDIPEMEADDDD